MTKEELAELIASFLNTPDERTRSISNALVLDDEPTVIGVDVDGQGGTTYFVEVQDV